MCNKSWVRDSTDRNRIACGLRVRSPKRKEGLYCTLYASYLMDELRENRGM